MTNQEKEKAAFQSVYDSGAKDALQLAWQAVNVLGAPETARVTDFDKAYCKAIEDTLRTIEELQMETIRPYLPYSSDVPKTADAAAQEASGYPQF